MVIENGSFPSQDLSHIVEPERPITAQAVMEIFGFDYRSVVRDILGNRYKLDVEGLNFFDTAARHLGSQALYLLEQPKGEHMIYVSYLPPNSITSEHEHADPIREVYSPLAGTSLLSVEGDLHELTAEKGVLVVDPGQGHQLRTTSEPALTLIVMKRAAGIPLERLHIPRNRQ